MANDLIIPQTPAQAIVRQVLTSMLAALQTRTDIHKQQLLSMMREYLDEAIDKYLNALEKTLD